MALRGEEQRQIWRAVQRLPIRLRAAVVLRYYHDLSYEELAQALACPIGRARSRLHAAHAKMRADTAAEVNLSNLQDWSALAVLKLDGSQLIQLPPENYADLTWSR